MKSSDLSEVVRGNAQLIERMKVLEREIAERQAEIKRLKGQLRSMADGEKREKVTPGVCASVKDFAQRGHSYREIAKTFGIGLTTVSLIVSDKYRTKRLGSAAQGV